MPDEQDGEDSDETDETTPVSVPAEAPEPDVAADTPKDAEIVSLDSFRK